MIATNWTSPPGHVPGTASWNTTRAPVVQETYVECRVCAFEPPGQLLLPHGSCPKCHGSSWQRAVRPAVSHAHGGQQ
jgi:hypothetical protein